MSVSEHKQKAPDCVVCAVITVSDTRTKETDKSGAAMHTFLQEEGHSVEFYTIVKDEQKDITAAVERAASHPAIQVILLNGGTGMASRDVTIETVTALFEKELIGFGELFRMISYLEDIGSAAMLSRAAAGTYKGRMIFATPGSTGAVRLAMKKLIMPELGHLVRELGKDQL
ncbi:molybdenum cofactor biosynthesis protein B [Heyndrickxia acidicola]|uniref:Molybdenum cofactor biosynthesis protein B n=1 Tax=Heyndrickxia acidicola TaxID=209389 RepID=A0ABU6MGP8_9BACI|nr:MogA/MoaB family molybdenum cofactor biosynthesis protein [Heyndrickxia acidicola]MED1203196.1 MogA/MoaB family molybdenum cofactor biosynthesis protein [Heyndrickxia acidicola]